MVVIHQIKHGSVFTFESSVLGRSKQEPLFPLHEVLPIRTRDIAQAVSAKVYS